MWEWDYCYYKIPHYKRPENRGTQKKIFRIFATHNRLSTEYFHVDFFRRKRSIADWILSSCRLKVWPLPWINTNGEIKVSNIFFIVVVDRLHILFYSNSIFIEKLNFSAPSFSCEFFQCENEKNTLCRWEFFSESWRFHYIVVSGDSSSIVIVEQLINSLINFGPKHTLIYSIDKDSKGSVGPESNDNWLSYEWYSTVDFDHPVSYLVWWLKNSTIHYILWFFWRELFLAR